MEFGETLTSLFNNKLFLQMLGAAGQDISAPPGSQVGANTNAVLQQNISSQNYMKLLSKMLAGHVPTGGKVTMDEKGTTISVPKTALDSLKVGSVNPFAQGGFAAPGAGQQNLSPGGGMPIPPTPVAPSPSPTPVASNNGGPFNPFAFDQLGNISGADLAGLTPQDISQALNIRLGQDELGLRKVSEANQQTYQQALMKHYEAQDQSSRLGMDAEMYRAETSRLAENRQWAELMQMAPLSVPGFGQLKLTDWKALPNDVQAFAYYAFNEGPKHLSFNQWKKQVDPEGVQNLYNAASKDKKFSDWLFAYKKAGATVVNTAEKIQEKVDTADALSKIDTQLYFRDTAKLGADLSKHIKDALENTIPGAGGEEKFIKKETIKFIETRLITGTKGAQIIERRESADGKTVGWLVEWPNGKQETIRVPIK